MQRAEALLFVSMGVRSQCKEYEALLFVSIGDSALIAKSAEALFVMVSSLIKDKIGLLKGQRPGD